MAPSSSTKANTVCLHNAVLLGDVSTVMELLDTDTSVIATDTEGYSPLHLAFINKNDLITDTILQRIQQTAEYTNVKNKHGLSHFHIACTRPNGKIVQGFLDARANPKEAVSKKSTLWRGYTAAHFAVKYKSLEVLKVLLKSNVDMRIKNSSGETPLSLANGCIEDWLIMMDLLKTKDDGPHLSNFHLACLMNNQNLVKNFIKHGIDVNLSTGCKTPIQNWSTPLHCAVESKDLKKVKLLLQKGAKIDSTNAEKMTPLHLAFYKKNPIYDKDSIKIADFLYKSVTDKSVNHEDIYGLSYFHIAISKNDLSILKGFIDSGEVDLNKPLSQHAPRFANFTPLQLAVWHQHPETAQYLIEKGADVNATNTRKLEKPLYMAFEIGDIDLVELLLKNDAKVNNTTDELENTMLHVLLLHCNAETPSSRGDQLHGNEKAILMYIEQLVGLGVDVNAKDSDGDTAMHYIHVEKEENTKYFQLLLDLGADVNLENNEGALPFDLGGDRSQGCNGRACAIFYHHVQKLKALGVRIHPKNVESCRLILAKKLLGLEELCCRGRQRTDEVIRMKSVMVSAVASLYDFLKLDAKRAALHARCGTLRDVAEDKDLEKKYPSYAYLIRLQYHKAVDCLQGRDGARKRVSSDGGESSPDKRQRYV